MTFLNTISGQPGVKNNNIRKTQAEFHLRHGGKQPRRLTMSPALRPAARTEEELALISDIEKMVADGRQKDLPTYFASWKQIPNRLGDWEIRVNVRKQDNKPVSRTIVALPLTVRARSVFEQGCLTTLGRAGYDEATAHAYYKAAWKRKYVWVDSVISAVKEMIDAFQNTSVLDSFMAAGDPRRLAQTVSVPKNPYQVSHAHFLVATEMAIGIIKQRLPQGGAEEQPSSSTEKEVSSEAA